MTQDLAASGMELPELMTAGRWKSARRRDGARWPGTTRGKGLGVQTEDRTIHDALDAPEYETSEGHRYQNRDHEGQEIQKQNTARVNRTAFVRRRIHGPS